MTTILPYTIAEGDTTNADKIEVNFRTLETELNEIVSSTGYIEIGTTLICYGVNACASSGTAITFPRAFASAPKLTATLLDTNFWGVWMKGISTTGATIAQAYTGNPLSVHWIAIGVNS